MQFNKSYTVMTGAEFNERMAGTKMYKLLNHNLKHYGYVYAPNALNGLDKLGETFDPDPDCKPGGLYFCTESDILRFVSCVTWTLSLGQAPLIVRVEIPEDARISIGEYKFKTDKLILGQPVIFDEFYSDEYIMNAGADYFITADWRKSIVWNILKKRYLLNHLLNPTKFDGGSHYIANLMIYAVWNADIEFLDLMLVDIQKILAHPPDEAFVINRLASALPPPLSDVIKWFSTHFPQHTSLMDIFNQPRGSKLPGYYTN